MGELPGIVQTVFGVVAVIAAGVAATLLASVRTLRESVGDRDKRIEGLEGRVTDLETSLTKEKADHEITRRDLEAVSKVVTGEAHLKAIETRIEDGFRVLNTIQEAVDKVADTVRKILTKVGGR